MNPQQLAETVSQYVYRLPPMPNHFDEILRAAHHPGRQEKAVRRLLRQDPGLCADLLHLANTFCDGIHQIDTIDEAVRCVGIQPIVQLIGLWYSRQTLQEKFASLQHLPQYFDHSQQISLGSRVLVEVLELPAHDRHFYGVLGLLHDIGRLVIMMAADQSSVRLMGTPPDQLADIIHDEKEIWGMNHCEVGYDVCARWHFSDMMLQGILRHHTPLINGDFSFPGSVIFVAHFITVNDMTGEILAGMLLQTLLQSMKLTAGQFNQARDRYRQLAARES